jgi:hypothetical protein
MCPLIQSGRSFNWSGQRDSNSRHQAWEACTLPAELCPLLKNCKILQKYVFVNKIDDLEKKEYFTFGRYFIEMSIAVLFPFLYIFCSKFDKYFWL